MLVSLLVGIATGFAMAIPPGPINFAVFEKSIHGQRRAACGWRWAASPATRSTV